MTFYEWFEAEEKENGFYCAPGSNVGNFAKKAYQAGAASRDAEVERLRNDISDAIDCKSGTGPTALSMVISERDQLREHVATLLDEVTRCRNWFDTLAKLKSNGGV